jgi:hypothetical protein
MSHHHVHPHPLCPPSQRCHRTFFAVVTVFILIPKPILIRCPYAALAIALASLVRSALFLLPFLVWLHSGRLPKMRGLQTSIINAFTCRGTSCKGSSNIFDQRSCQEVSGFRFGRLAGKFRCFYAFCQWAFFSNSWLSSHWHIWQILTTSNLNIFEYLVDFDSPMYSLCQASNLGGYQDFDFPMLGPEVRSSMLPFEERGILIVW